MLTGQSCLRRSDVSSPCSLQPNTPRHFASLSNRFPLSGVKPGSSDSLKEHGAPQAVQSSDARQVSNFVIPFFYRICLPIQFFTSLHDKMHPGLAVKVMNRIALPYRVEQWLHAWQIRRECQANDALFQNAIQKASKAVSAIQHRGTASWQYANNPFVMEAACLPHDEISIVCYSHWQQACRLGIQNQVGFVSGSVNFGENFKIVPRLSGEI